MSLKITDKIKVFLILLGCPFLLFSQQDCDNFTETPIPFCQCTDCGDIDPVWETVGSSTICEGTPFQLTGQSSTATAPATIEDYHWYIIDGLDLIFQDVSTSPDLTYNYVLNSMDPPDCDDESIVLTVVLITTSPACPDGESCRRNLKDLEVFLRPRAAFTSTAPACIGQEIDFTNLSCYATEFEWDFGDGSPLSTDENPSHTYTTPGTYIVTLNAFNNNCTGASTIQIPILILEPPTAVAVPISGVNDPTTEPFVICLDEGGLVCIDGDSLSLNETRYEWDVLQSSGYILNQDSIYNPDIKIIFTTGGFYEVVLETDNACMQPAYDTLTFEVVDPGDLSLLPQDDACVSLMYTPDPLDTDVIYTINGVVTNSFPANLGVGTYAIEAVLDQSFCNPSILADTFFILPDSFALIQMSDTTICALDGSLVLTAIPGNGNWQLNGSNFNGTLNPNQALAGINTITYGNEPCIKTDTLLVEVIKVDIDMPPPAEVCLDEPPVTFTAMPSGGIWSGIGVDSFGLFDPVIAGIGEQVLYYQIQHPTITSCANIDSVIITVSQLFVDFAVDTCTDNTLFFDTLNTSDFSSIFWEFGDGGTSNQTSPSHTYPAASSYMVTVTIGSGACTASNTNTVTVEPPPVADFSLDFDPGACSPLTVTITDNSLGTNLQYEWLLNGMTSNSPSPGPIVLTAAEQDTLIEISLLVRNGCSSSTQTEMILVRPQPIALFGTDLNEYCSGDTIVLSNNARGNPESYQWLLDDAPISTDSVPPIISHLTDVTDTTEICLIVQNTCGRDTLCREVIVEPTDVDALFNTSDPVICLGDTVWLTNFSTANVPVVYDFGDNTLTSNPNPFHVYQDTGTYTISQKAFGCGFGLFEQTISVSPVPAAAFQNPAFGCPGDVLQFTSESIDAVSFAWDFGDSTAISDLSAPIHVYPLAGNYEVCLTVFSANDCSDTHCENVVIHQAPQAGFSFLDSLCDGSEVNFINESSADVQNCSYDFGDGNVEAICAPLHTYATDGIYVVTQIVTNQNLCKDTSVQQVYIRPIPIPDFDFSNSNGCHPDSVVFTNTSQLANSFDWNFGDGSSSDLTNPIHEYLTPGIFTVSLNAGIDAICFAELSKTVEIKEMPIADFVTTNPNNCAEAEISFDNLSTGSIENVTWSFGDGLFSFEMNPVHVFEMAGTFPVQLIVSTNEGCADTLTQDILIGPALKASLAITPILCNGENTGAIDLSVNAGTAPFSFNWSNGVQTEDINELPSGPYTIVVIDDNGCEWEESIELEEPPALNNMAVETPVSCFGGNDGGLTLEISGGSPDYAIEWDFGANSIEIRDQLPGDYSVTITDDNDCTLESIFSISEPGPIEYLDSVRHITCFGEDDGYIELDSIFGGTAPYFAELSGNGLEKGGTRFDSLVPGVYEVLIEDANACSTTFEVEIREPVPIAVNILEDSIFLSLGESEDLATFYNAANPVFVWSPEVRLSCIDCPEPVADPQVSQIYSLLMTDENGCAALDSVFVFVDANRDVFLPNVFTPNGDLRNDLFRVRSKFEESIEAIRIFRIFDRWGELIFDARDFIPNDRNYGWDGTFRGEAAQPGTYTFYAEVEYVDGFSKIKTGDFLLVR